MYLRLKRDSSSSPACVSDVLFEWKEFCRFYRKLLRRKESFWNTKVRSELKSPRHLWSSLNKLLGHGTSFSDSPSPQDLHDFFLNKIQSIQEATDVPTSLLLTTTSSASIFQAFQSVSIDRVIQIVKCLPTKSSSSDPLPCRFLKSCIDLLAPFLVCLFNLSLKSGIFLSPWKHYSKAAITPILKKGKIDPSTLHLIVPFQIFLSCRKSSRRSSQPNTALMLNITSFFHLFSRPIELITLPRQLF